jgi:hypothetical protein
VITSSWRRSMATSGWRLRICRRTLPSRRSECNCLVCLVGFAGWTAWWRPPRWPARRLCTMWWISGLWAGQGRCACLSSAGSHPRSKALFIKEGFTLGVQVEPPLRRPGDAAPAPPPPGGRSWQPRRHNVELSREDEDWNKHHLLCDTLSGAC